jgi:hypothetical protein
MIKNEFAINIVEISNRKPYRNAVVISNIEKLEK